MRQRRQDQSIDIGDDVGHRFAVFRRSERQLGFQIARLNLRKHRQLFNAFEVIGDPIDQFMAMTAELFAGHVAETGCRSIKFRGRFIHH